MKKLERPSKVTAKTKIISRFQGSRKAGEGNAATEKSVPRAVDQHRKAVKPVAKAAPTAATKKPPATPVPAAKAAPPKPETAAPVAAAKPAAKSPPAAKPAALSAADEAHPSAPKPAEAAISKPAEPKSAEIRQLHEKPIDHGAPMLSSISAVKPLPVPRITSAAAEPQRPRSFQSMSKSVPKISRLPRVDLQAALCLWRHGQDRRSLGTENGSELGFGFVRLTKARIPWTIKYDEVLFVIIGTLRVRTGGRTLELGPHDSIFLPAGTELVYEADDALVTYAIQPASAARMPPT